MNVHKKTFQYGPHIVTLETGRMARQADGAVLVSMGDTSCSSRPWPASSPTQQGLLSADRQLRREDVRGRPHPGRLLQARRTSDRERDADLAPHRPADPAAVPRRLLQRSPGGRDRRVARSRHRFRHPGDARRVGGADLAGIPFRGPIGGAKSATRRPVPPQSDRHGPARLPARPRRRRHERCVLMVESRRQLPPRQ